MPSTTCRSVIRVSLLEVGSHCARLQEMFDTAGDNHDIQSADGDLEMMQISSGHMETADDRMEEVGCYD